MPKQDGDEDHHNSRSTGIQDNQNYESKDETSLEKHKSNSNDELNLFKQVHQRHRRQGKDPCRIDDAHEWIDFSRYDKNQETNNHGDSVIIPIPPLPSSNRRTRTTKTTTRITAEPGRTTAENNSTDRTKDHGCTDAMVSPIMCADDPTGSYFYSGPMYTLVGAPGFYYAPQALHPRLQNQLSWAAVTEYCEPPHRTNIDLIPPKSFEEDNRYTNNNNNNSSSSNNNKNTSDDDNCRMWSLWKKENPLPNNLTTETSTKYIPPVTESTILPQTSVKSMKKRQAPTLSKKKKYRCFQKLTWATMGYHYDWTVRSYDENQKSEMPSRTIELSKFFARTALQQHNRWTEQLDQYDIVNGNAATNDDDHPYNLQHSTFFSGTIDNATKTKTTDDIDSKSCGKIVPLFEPTACIVNYYHEKSVMGGHQDDLEEAMEQPIVSFSMGLPAIFVLGQDSKTVGPIYPILVRPGDVMIMTGPARWYYHSMARILPLSTPIPPPLLSSSLNLSLPQVFMKWDDATAQWYCCYSTKVKKGDNNPQSLRSNDDGDDDAEQRAVELYLSKHRININVRQVYHSSPQQSDKNNNENVDERHVPELPT